MWSSRPQTSKPGRPGGRMRCLGRDGAKRFNLEITAVSSVRLDRERLRRHPAFRGAELSAPAKSPSGSAELRIHAFAVLPARWSLRSWNSAPASREHSDVFGE